MNSRTIEDISYAITIAGLIVSSIVILYYIFESVKKHKLKEKLILGLSILVTIIIGFICLVIKPHYGVDSFAVYWDMAPFHALTEGRYLKAAVTIFCMRHGINQIAVHQMAFLCWIPVTAVSVLLIEEAFSKCLSLEKLSDKLKITFILLLFVVNPFYMELTMFPVVPLDNMVINIIFGSGIYIFFSSVKRPVRWLITFFMMFAVTTGYQCYMPMFVILMLTGITIKYINDIKIRYAESVFAVISGVCSYGLDFLMMKIFENIGIIAPCDSVGDIRISDIVNNAIGVIKVQLKVWISGNGTYLFPFIMPLIALALLFLIYKLFVSFDSKEKKIYLILMILGSYLLIFAVHFIEVPQEITPRSILPLWDEILGIFMMAFALIGKEEVNISILRGRVKNISFDKLVSTVVLLILIINLWQVNDIALNQLDNNAIDFAEAQAIADKINDYQKETGIVINDTVMRSDGNLTYHHKNSRYKVYQLGARIMATSFSRYHMIGYFLGRDLKDTFMSDEDFARLGQGRDWDSFNIDEQVFIEGDKVYILVY